MKRAIERAQLRSLCNPQAAQKWRIRNLLPRKVNSWSAASVHSLRLSLSAWLGEHKVKSSSSAMAEFSSLSVEWHLTGFELTRRAPDWETLTSSKGCLRGHLFRPIRRKSSAIKQTTWNWKYETHSTGCAQSVTAAALTDQGHFNRRHLLFVGVFASFCGVWEVYYYRRLDLGVDVRRRTFSTWFGGTRCLGDRNWSVR